MRSANVGPRVLQWTLPVAVLIALSGCDLDFWGRSAAGPASPAPTPTYTVGGTVSGLASGATLTLLDNGSDTLNISASGPFSFSTSLAGNAGYAVTIGMQPTGQMCTVAGGTGTIGATDVADVVVTCSDRSYMLGGTISGLGANTGLVLMNGTDMLDVPANATTFTMSTSVVNGAAYNITVAAPLTAACSVTNGSGTIAAADVTNIAVACSIHTESVLYSFSGAPTDGDEPWYASLLQASDGNFYGMTAFGGTNNEGTVFKITPAGVETVLWSFGNGNDGANPYGSLIQASDGNFYGMTNLGGTHGVGTVFKITPAGVETVLWSFGNGNDGSNPFGSLVEGTDGNFYGMTYVGGQYQGYVGTVYQGGTIFKITPAGVETVLWSLGNGSDGSMPYGKLTLGGDGNFYGTTYAGGVNGKGTILKITPTGAETVLWSFGSGGDGAHPTGSPTLGTDGNFYGLTIDGGANDMGIVFKITPSGAETVLHSFANTGDGYNPQGSLIQGTDGNFYGVAGIGGLAGWGTIFEITPSGTETVLYSFGAGPAGDGQGSFGALIQATDGTFYGMTSRGGANDHGTVFTFK